MLHKSILTLADRSISLVYERHGSVVFLHPHLVLVEIKRKNVYVFTGYHFAIITVSLSKRHCSQNETEGKYMLMNLFIPVHMNTLRSFSNRFIFSFSHKFAHFNIQSSKMQLSANLCADFKLFSIHFFLLLMLWFSMV